MSQRRDGLRPGEVARAKRIARAIANAMWGLNHPRRVLAVRNVVARLKEQKLRPRDFDNPNGEDAIAAIICTMPRREFDMTVGPLGKIWELAASRACQYLGASAS